MIGETTPSALATLVRHGEDVVVKSIAAKFIWSVAPELRSHVPQSTS